MKLDDLIAAAHQQGASDLHLEPGLPPALRVRGTLRLAGDALPPRDVLEMAREVVGAAHWPQFLERRSHDLSKNIRGVRCRINVLQTSRGVGLAVRLLASFQATVEKLNLHPDFRKFVTRENGLILLTGPTGCGKSSTLAALIQEINLGECRHVVTIESPIEYVFTPRRAYLRQREVGRDTPSFEQALLDALREDPDVLMVGEMRDPETMRLTLNASETGHLVLATMHSGSCVEALQRIVSAFPSEAQGNVRAQLADCLVAVIAQRLRYRSDLKIPVPECEVLVPTSAVKAHLRAGDFFKIASALEIGAEAGMWTFARYQTWLEAKKTWHIPGAPEAPEPELGEAAASVALPPLRPVDATKIAEKRPAAASAPGGEAAPASRAIEIEPVEGGLDELIKKLGSE
jgi:twitching motility protein PilT